MVCQIAREFHPRVGRVSRQTVTSTLALERAGWSRKTLQVGDQVTITGFGGRAATQRAIAQTITSADGKALFSGKLGQ